MSGQTVQFQSIVSDKLALFGLVVVILLAVYFGIRWGESSTKQRKAMMCSFNDTVQSSRRYDTSTSNDTGSTDSVIIKSSSTRGKIQQNYKPDFAKRLFGNVMAEIFTVRKQDGASSRVPVIEMIGDDEVSTGVSAYIGKSLSEN